MTLKPRFWGCCLFKTHTGTAFKLVLFRVTKYHCVNHILLIKLFTLCYQSYDQHADSVAELEFAKDHANTCPGLMLMKFRNYWQDHQQDGVHIRFGAQKIAHRLHGKVISNCLSSSMYY